MKSKHKKFKPASEGTVQDAVVKKIKLGAQTPPSQFDEGLFQHTIYVSSSGSKKADHYLSEC